jgi:hypothetical protein
MRDNPAAMNDAQAAPKRAAARKTALLFGGIAIAVYVGFILMGVLGR